MKSFVTKPRRLVYLDYAAATPVSQQVKAAMQPFFAGLYGNPSSLHTHGQKARQALEKSRKTIASIISARPEEVVFTAGGTESCNLAILGLSKALGRRKAHFIASSIEHPAVLAPLFELKKQGHSLTLLKVDPEGFVSIQELAKAIRPETQLVSIMYANNEIGTLQPISEFGRFLKKINQERSKKRLLQIYFHTDACQAAGLRDLSVARLGVDLMTVNGGKIYGSKQSGFLYIKNSTSMSPLILGGGQERGLRSGTENVAFAVGLAKALELAQKGRQKETLRLLGLQSYLFRTLQKQFPKLILNGPKLDLKRRLVNNLNFTLPGIEGEALLLYLDAHGIAVSTGSACSSNDNRTSHVLKAIGVPEFLANNNIRISLGAYTKKSDIDYFIKIFNFVVTKLKIVVNKI